MSNLINPKPGNYALILLLLPLVTIFFTTIHAQDCNPSGSISGTQAPSDQCNPNESSCCQAGSDYQTYTCSPPVTGRTPAVLTLNSFEKGRDGGGASQCDEQFHSDKTLVVALSTGWYNGGSRCGREIVINGNGRSVRAQVVDQCDSTVGCDEEHGFQLPCRNNVVDGSKAVWEALGVDPDSPEYGEMEITWSDA